MRPRRRAERQTPGDEAEPPRDPVTPLLGVYPEEGGHGARCDEDAPGGITPRDTRQTPKDDRGVTPLARGTWPNSQGRGAGRGLPMGSDGLTGTELQSGVIKGVPGTGGGDGHPTVRTYSMPLR